MLILRDLGARRGRGLNSLRGQWAVASEQWSVERKTGDGDWRATNPSRLRVNGQRSDSVLPDKIGVEGRGSRVTVNKHTEE